MRLTQRDLSVVVTLSFLLVCLVLLRAPALPDTHADAQPTIVAHRAAAAGVRTGHTMGSKAPAPAHAPSAGMGMGIGGSGGGLFTTKPFDHLVGKRALDTEAGDAIPPRDAGADAAGLGPYEGADWVDVRALAASRPPRHTRILRPDMAATMDYVVERLNIHIGEDGKISGVTMG